jgi:hypothetical protein
VEVAPQFFKVADANKISKRKRQEKIEPLFNKVCIADDAVHNACPHFFTVREAGRMAIIKSQAECSFGEFISRAHYLLISDASPAESNIWLRILPADQILYSTV